MKFLKLALLVFAAGCQSTGGSDTNESGAESSKPDANLTWIKRAYPTGKRSTSAVLVERGLLEAA